MPKKVLLGDDSTTTLIMDEVPEPKKAKLAAAADV